MSSYLFYVYLIIFIIQELFWKLVELRLPPENERKIQIINIYGFIFVYQKSLKRTFKTSF